MNLNNLSREAYETAKAHGWHDKEYSDEHFLMLIITEIAEAVQAELEEQRKRMEEDRKFIEEEIKNYDLKINKLKVTP